MPAEEDEPMGRDSFPQYAQIEHPFGCDPPVVHCPICGQATLEIDEDGREELTPCPHLAFIFSGETGGFAYASESFEKKCNGPDFDGDAESIEEFLIKAGCGSKILALEITYGGRGCEPLWFTDVYGFDYETLNTEDSASWPVHCTYAINNTVQ